MFLAFSPLAGTMIAQNVVSNEAFDVVVNTPTEVRVDFNNLLDVSGVGVDNLGAGSIYATENWCMRAAAGGRRRLFSTPHFLVRKSMPRTPSHRAPSGGPVL